MIVETSVMTHTGLLISFEGMEGAGKTTQCDLLTRALEKLGHEVVVVREPGGVPISEQIRDVVLNPKNKKMDMRAEVLLFQAARAQLYGELVLPSLEAGKHVLMDRTRDSSLVYQGIVRGMGVEWIEQLNDYATQKTVPDLTFLLDLPPEVGMQRRMKVGKLDRIEQEGVELQRQVCKAYLEVARANKDGRWVIVDALQPLSQVTETVWAEVEQKLKK